MYVNPHFAERELPILQDIIEAVRFGVLVICSDGPLAAHIPFVLHRDEGQYGTLVAHVSARDPLARHLDGGHEALAIFSAPRAYISPRWCPSGGLPTYNYLAVHAYGRPRVLEDPDVVLGHLGELVDVHEERFPRRGRSQPSPRTTSLNGCLTSPPSGSRSTRSRASASSARTAPPRTATGLLAGCASAAGTTTWRSPRSWPVIRTPRGLCSAW